MKLKRREKILAAMTAVLAVVFAGNLLMGGISNPLAPLRQRRDNLRTEVEKKQDRVDRSRRDAEKLEAYRHAALPSDPLAAASNYQNWLYELGTRSGLSGTKVDPAAERNIRDIYRSFAFTVRGRGTLSELTDFLHAFYSAGHLHQLRRLDVSPVENSSELDLVLTIEALSLPGTGRTDALSAETSHKLAGGELASYREAIVGRNVFAPYKPPPPPRVVRTEPRDPGPPPPPPFDHAKHTYVTGITAVGGVRQVWIDVRTKGEKLRLGEGEEFDAGHVHGRVVHIGQDDVIIELDGQRELVARGDNLREGMPVPE